MIADGITFYGARVLAVAPKPENISARIIVAQGETAISDSLLTVLRLAQPMDLTRANVFAGLEGLFDEPLNTDWDGNELLLSDVLGTDGDTVLRALEDSVDHQLLQEALSRLSERDLDIIATRFGLGGRQPQTQKEVADRLGISQSYISRLEKRILERLRLDITQALSA